jgi:hypothetical protein
MTVTTFNAPIFAPDRRPADGFVRARWARLWRIVTRTRQDQADRLSAHYNELLSE